MEVRRDCDLSVPRHREAEESFCRDLRTLTRVCFEDWLEHCPADKKSTRVTACQEGDNFLQTYGISGCDPDVIEPTLKTEYASIGFPDI